MGVKVKAQKFDTINKAQIKGKAGHTRTGACTARGKCYCRNTRKAQRG